ncbi:MAG: hypothetical protein JO034_07230 [Singulisphaera sp.]|nr:hypothetical protein [Singulisphaera sp.]
MTFCGQVKNGVVVLPEGVTLREGSIVRVELVEETTPALSLAERLGEWSGKGVGLPEDLARNHDHYLHGQTRR